MPAEYLQRIDTQTQGLRYAVMPLFADPAAFAALLDDIEAHTLRRRPARIGGQ